MLGLPFGSRIFLAVAVGCVAIACGAAAQMQPTDTAGGLIPTAIATLQPLPTATSGNFLGCDLSPTLPEPKGLASYQVQLGPRMIEFDGPTDWDVAAFRNDQTGEPYVVEIRDHRYCFGGIEIRDWLAFPIFDYLKPTDVSSWKTGQARQFGERQTVLEEREVEVSGVTGVMIVRKTTPDPSFPSDVFAAWAASTEFISLITFEGRFYEFEMWVRDENLGESQRVFLHFLETVRFSSPRSRNER